MKESKYNHILSREFWDHAAQTVPESWILDGRSKDYFWNTEVKIEGLSKEKVFLDLGCGIGRVAKWVAPYVKAYNGVDFSPEMIEKAREIYRKYPNVNFFVNNGFDLEIFSDGIIDIVYVSLLFQHMQKENTLNYIKEVFRVLKKGGIFFANDIPRAERYVGGLNGEELESAFKPFKILNKEVGLNYCCIKCQK